MRYHAEIFFLRFSYVWVSVIKLEGLLLRTSPDMHLMCLFGTTQYELPPHKNGSPSHRITVSWRDNVIDFVAKSLLSIKAVTKASYPVRMDIMLVKPGVAIDK